MIGPSAGRRAPVAASVFAEAASLTVLTHVSAQVTGATLRGVVTDRGSAEGSAEVVARDIASAFNTRTRTTASGTYVMSGLRPGSCEQQFRVVSQGNLSRRL